MERLYTIGVYGWEADRFFAALQNEDVDLFLDIRRRRGVRGSQYTFANAGRLTDKLDRLGIAYRHIIELSPDDETRYAQYREDDAEGIAKRQRTHLHQGFIDRYTQRALDHFDWPGLIADLEGSSRPVLFCVERTPEACHRHLAAERLAALTGIPMSHLVP